MAECGGTIQYIGGPQFICTRPAGHKGPHFGVEAPGDCTSSKAPVAWTCSIAAIQPWRW